VATWHLVALSIIIGLINGFDIPTRQAFVNELVDDPEDLPNAIALNSMIFNGARLLGPPVAGIIIYAAGEGVCFAINTVSYIAVLIALLMMRIRPSKAKALGGPVLKGLKDGVVYAWNFVPIRTVLVTLAYISLIGMPYAVLMPIFARDVLKGGPQTLGFLLGAVAVGALGGALFLASRTSVRGLGRIIVIAIMIFGAAVVAFSFSTWLWVSLALMAGAGFGMMVQMASINTILQTLVDEDKRGRVMSLYTMAFIGMAPFGSLIAGSIAAHIGAPHTVQISGSLSLLGGLWFLKQLPEVRRHAHAVYVKKGIIPEVATGLGSAAAAETEIRE
jgi:MFS family permease